MSHYTIMTLTHVHYSDPIKSITIFNIKLYINKYLLSFMGRMHVILSEHNKIYISLTMILRVKSTYRNNTTCVQLRHVLDVH